ncbi:MAG: hypothetical protein IPM74_01360 [Crocinitomicaceae bacterium]|nr:hypothetical protein [Crocinitomicaceae bacterium]MBK8924564.1 hypothetical protein [Crocinitomicaceae bacterium]
MNKLFSEFQAPDYDTWVNQIKKDLKDKPLSALESNPEYDLDIIAYHHPTHDQGALIEPSVLNYFQRQNNNWQIRKVYEEGQNAIMLHDLNKGVNAISIPAINSNQVKVDLKDVHLDHITADIRFENAESALNSSVPFTVNLNFDVLSLNAKAGNQTCSLHDFLLFYQKNPDSKSIWVDGSIYGNAGAGTIEELAFTLSHLNEYVHFLHVENKIALQEINKKLILELSVTENYFVNIAKYRVIRQLMQLLFKAYDATYEMIMPIVYATTSARFLALNDANNNYLRQTTQAMSAVLGGCDVLTISIPAGLDEKSSNIAHHMATNIQLVLAEESFLNQVTDPAAGSYYLESLSDQILTKAWNLFQQIEENGGWMKSIENNMIQNQIEETRSKMQEDIQTGKKSFLGVNRYPNKTEQWIQANHKLESTGKEFNPIKPFIAEHYYQPQAATK